jgi:hypothetical protein
MSTAPTHSFMSSALDGDEFSASRPGRAFPRGKDPRYPGWVDPRAGLDTEARGKILFPCRGSNPDRPVVQSVARHYTDWATRLTSILPFKTICEGLWRWCIVKVTNYLDVCRHNLIENTTFRRLERVSVFRWNLQFGLIGRAIPCLDRFYLKMETDSNLLNVLF